MSLFFQPLTLTLFRVCTGLVGDDFPPTLPGIESRRIAVVVEESVRYALADPESTAEWYTAFPDTVGPVRLGSSYRALNVAMYHEIHCLQQFRDVLARTRSPVYWRQVQHCLNYLREWSLCQADLTLEPGDFTTRNFTEDRTGSTHVCHDWEPVANAVAANWDSWLPVWRRLHNISKAGDCKYMHIISPLLLTWCFARNVGVRQLLHGQISLLNDVNCLEGTIMHICKFIMRLRRFII